ncbi:phage tail protein [Flexibacterium corallicola]|uniref:phage tail protein n=1 Tax=Flexibacterium corallicola TaxID=3037259 RepID=UPI00286F10FD|nr:hypothetical protein [Pseudovibrio sp. M1P-2-3]
MLPSLILAVSPVFFGFRSDLPVPKGAIVAFAKTFEVGGKPQVCPPGWSPVDGLAGRMPLGAGAGADLTPRAVGDIPSGTETHKLTVNEMPSHTHRYGYSSGIRSPKHDDTTASQFGQKDQSPETSATGGSKPHNNMPPYYVVQFCRLN